MATRIICDGHSASSIPSTSASIRSKQPAPSSFNSQCHRHRLLKRLRERLQLPSSDWSINEDGYSNPVSKPTVIRVGGTVSSCASSTVRSTAGSWRLVEELFRRNGTASSRTSTPPAASTISSTKSSRSNKTIIYDDRWLEVEKPNFCTVVTVPDERSGKTDRGGTVVTVNALDESETESAASDAHERHSTASALSMQGENGSPEDKIRVCQGEYAEATGAYGDERATPEFMFPASSDHFNQSTPPISSAGTLQPAGLSVPQSQCISAGAAGPAPLQICTENVLPPAGHRVLAPEDLPGMYPRNAWSALGAPLRLQEEAEQDCKGCCGSGRGSQSLFLRWFIALISLIGVSCVIVGAALGALIATGSTRLTLCLLMIGVGLVLVTVSGITWRLTASSAFHCANFIRCLDVCGLHSATTRRRRRRAAMLVDGMSSRHRYSRVQTVGRQGPCSLPPGVCVPPEFLWRPPPPSYYASVHEDRLRSVLGYNQSAMHASVGSPPPTYRSSRDSTRHRPPAAELVQRCSRIGSPRTENFHVFASMGDSSRTQASGDCVLMPEPVQQDEAASLVMNEQLQSTNVHPEPHQPFLSMARRNPISQFADPRLSHSMPIQSTRWTYQYGAAFRPGHPGTFNGPRCPTSAMPVPVVAPGAIPAARPVHNCI